MTERNAVSKFPSIKLDQLVYVELEPSNGGMMLTVSEEGFSFRAVTPVRASPRVPFAFTINGTQKLQGFGKIEWTKDDGKVAGLQFADVTSDFLRALRKWLGQLSPATPPAAEKSSNSGFEEQRGFGLPNTPIEASPAIDGNALEERSEPALKSGHPFRRLDVNSDDSGTADTSRQVAANNGPAPTPVFSDWNYPSGLEEQPRSHVHAVKVAAAVICFMALVAVLYGYREALGHSLIAMGQRMTSSSSQTSQPPQMNDSEAVAPTTPAKQTNTTQVDSVKKDTIPSQTEAGSTAKNAEKPLSGPSHGGSRQVVKTTATPESQISEPHSSDPAEEARLLWSAVSKGNTPAEVTLAKLYLIGSGVSKSCAQAKVLFQAAAKKGNSEAISKLSQINRQGCP
jgi:hypothetical protein